MYLCPEGSVTCWWLWRRPPDPSYYDNYTSSKHHSRTLPTSALQKYCKLMWNQKAVENSSPAIFLLQNGFSVCSRVKSGSVIMTLPCVKLTVCNITVCNRVKSGPAVIMTLPPPVIPNLAITLITTKRCLFGRCRKNEIEVGLKWGWKINHVRKLTLPSSLLLYLLQLFHQGWTNSILFPT